MRTNGPTELIVIREKKKLCRHLAWTACSPAVVLMLWFDAAQFPESCVERVMGKKAVESMNANLDVIIFVCQADRIRFSTQH